MLKGLNKRIKLFKRTVKHPTDIGISEHNLFTFPEMPGKEEAGAEMAKVTIYQDCRKCELQRNEKSGFENKLLELLFHFDCLIPER